MSAAYTIEIERLVLDGIDLSPAEAEHLRSALVGELQRMLGVPQQTWPGDQRSVDQARVMAQPLLDADVAASRPGRLASELAQRVVDSVQASARV